MRISEEARAAHKEVDPLGLSLSGTAGGKVRIPVNILLEFTSDLIDEADNLEPRASQESTDTRHFTISNCCYNGGTLQFQGFDFSSPQTLFHEAVRLPGESTARK